MNPTKEDLDKALAKKGITYTQLGRMLGYKSPYTAIYQQVKNNRISPRAIMILDNADALEIARLQKKIESLEKKILTANNQIKEYAKLLALAYEEKTD